MIVYHEADPDTIEHILKEGIKQGSSGQKTDGLIHKTDTFLDSRIPEQVAADGVSRCDNIYACIEKDGKVLKITDGNSKQTADFIHDSDQAVIAIEVDPSRCFVSDLDSYDAVKQALKDETDEKSRGSLADAYWSKIVPLSTYENDSLARPEIMITYDVIPDAITLLKTI